MRRGHVIFARWFDLHRYARTKLFAPLGIDAFGWSTDVDGHPFAGGDLLLNRRAMASLGQLTADDNGRRQGRDLMLSSMTQQSPPGFADLACEGQSAPAKSGPSLWRQSSQESILPLIFEAALARRGIHTLQHTSFLISALLFWWAIFGNTSRGERGAHALLSLFTTMVHTGALGALLTLAPGLWYPSYIESTSALGFDPLQDQQLGGLVMWVPGGSARGTAVQDG